MERLPGVPVAAGKAGGLVGNPGGLTMCGLFGFVSKNDQQIDLSILREVAEVTMRRGPHAWGLAWVDRSGRLRTFKQSGRVVDSLGLLSMAEGATLLVGHCRFATHGDPSDNSNNHPHSAGRGLVVHNGVIHHYRDLVHRHGLKMRTQCDSEVIGLMAQKFKGTPFVRMAKACREAMGSSPFASLAIWPDRVIATTANGQPLHVSESRNAYWLASLSDGLPGRVSKFPQGQVLEFA
jgi:glucosamine--fructose-6-phosphate aminotransferase (isomerizing)